jgi:hypothetical protein
VIAHINGGKYGDKKIAEAATVDDMHRPYMTTGASSEFQEIVGGEYALGWFVDTYRGRRRVQHGGNIDGFSANVVLFPKDGVGIVVLTNLNGTPLRDLITQVAADRLFKFSQVDWITQAAGRLAMLEQAGKEGEKKKEVTRVQGTQMSHKLEDYAGDYEHPGYGVLKVALRAGKLEATFNNIATPLEHWHYDTFNGGRAKDPVFNNMKYSFQTDVNGNVATVSAQFEASVKEIVFAKKLDARLFDPAYLSRYAGAYDLMGQSINVSLKGAALVAVVGGQPPMDLIPTLSGDFTLKQVQVVSIHFIMDDKGNAASFELRQPGTVLTAKRKQ